MKIKAKKEAQYPSCFLHFLELIRLSTLLIHPLGLSNQVFSVLLCFHEQKAFTTVSMNISNVQKELLK